MPDYRSVLARSFGGVELALEEIDLSPGRVARGCLGGAVGVGVRVGGGIEDYNAPFARPRRVEGVVALGAGAGESGGDPAPLKQSK